jgi:hypothetical protein
MKQVDRILGESLEIEIVAVGYNIIYSGQKYDESDYQIFNVESVPHINYLYDVNMFVYGIRTNVDFPEIDTTLAKASPEIQQILKGINSAIEKQCGEDWNWISHRNELTSEDNKGWATYDRVTVTLKKTRCSRDNEWLTISSPGREDWAMNGWIDWLDT